MNSKSVIILLTVLLAFLLYLPTLAAPWQFDDLEHVVHRNQESKDQLFDLLLATIQPASSPKGTRSLVAASFLLNWQISQKPLGFHIVNITIHALAAFFVYLLLYLILSRCKWQEKQLVFWSIAGAVLFLIHPIQSQAVAYVTQRFESLASLFYLASMYFFLSRRYLWSWLAGFLAVSSKEIAITLPLTLIALDFFFGRSYKHGKKQIILYLLFFLLSLKVVVQLTTHVQDKRPLSTSVIINKLTAGTQVLERQRGLTRISYGLTQLNVVPTYIRLLVLPYGQSLDHDFPVTTNFWQWPTPLSSLFILILMAIMLVSSKRQPLLSFALFFFFLTLSISSSIFPIDDVFNEHRLYLPMFGFVLFVIALAGRSKNIIYQKFIIKFIIFIIFIFSFLTFRRALIWSQPLLLWEDAWKKAPAKARTNKNYGFLLTEAGQIAEGIARLKRAVELNPTSSDYHRNLGLAYLKAAMFSSAEQEFKKAVELDPGDAKPLADLGVAHAQQGKTSESLSAFRASLQLQPDLIEGLIGLGGVSVLSGDFETAEKNLLKAINIAPNDPRVLNNLAVLYLKTKDYTKAQAVLNQLALVDPNYPGLKEKIEEVRQLQHHLD